VVQVVKSARGAAIMRWLRRIVLGSVAALVLLIIGVWVEHALPIELPRPSGPSPIGRTSRTLGAGIAAWIWYPAKHRDRVAPYLPDSIRESWARARPGVINLLTRNLSKVRAHGVFDAPFAADPARSPVILFRGGGGGGALSYTALFEELASRGYVVAALEGGNGGHPEACVGSADEDACAEKLLNAAIAMMGVALDRLMAVSATDPLLGGHLDSRTLGVFGHSFGGAQALAFCAADSRCTAGVNIDGRLFGSLERSKVTAPFLWLLSDHGSAQDSVSRQVLGQIQSVYARQPAENRMWIVIRGANHFTFSDDGALLKSGALRGIMRLIGVLGIGGRRQIEVSSYAVRSFFDVWLKHAGGAHGWFASPSYPEIVRMQ
jgi:predicted dienelactone hydrolase